MFRALGQVWWLLAVCGMGDAVLAVMNLLMMDPERSLGLRIFASRNQVWDMSVLALASGMCAIAAGLWSSRRGKTWLLSLHGFALGAFGLLGLSPLVKGPLSFRGVSLLFVLMTVSLGAFALQTAQTSGSGASGRWFLRFSGGVSLFLALSFLAVSFGWVRLRPPTLFWIWMSLNYGIFATVMLYLGLRGYGKRISPFPGKILPQT